MIKGALKLRAFNPCDTCPGKDLCNSILVSSDFGRSRREFLQLANGNPETLISDETLGQRVDIARRNDLENYFEVIGECALASFTQSCDVSESSKTIAID
jgi:hypothetical protein